MFLFKNLKGREKVKDLLKNSSYGTLKHSFSSSPAKDTSGCLYVNPKVYAEANLNKAKDYYDFENMKLDTG